MRLGVYTDYPYHLVNGRPTAERAFALFLAELRNHLDGVLVLGRLNPDPHGGRYELGDVDFVPLPYYPRLTSPLPALRGMAGSIRSFWRSLDHVDCVWLLGPHPLAIAFAILAWTRRRRVVLGVRQQFLAYVRHRHPRARLPYLLALMLEGSFRLLGRFCRVVVVGPAVARDYRRAAQVLEVSVSLIREGEIASEVEIRSRDYDGELTALSVGRLDPEKNPLALAEVLEELGGRQSRWRLIVCGEGSLAAELAERLRALGLEDRADLLGYVPHGDALRAVYARSHALLHVSWTEGLPQVLYEGFASGLPTVATEVGGVGAATNGATLLVPPGRPDLAAEALGRIGSEAALREALIARGLELARSHTLERESERVAAFLAAP